MWLRITGSGDSSGFPRIMPSVKISGFDDWRPKKIDTISFLVGSDSQSASVRPSGLCLQSEGSGKRTDLADWVAAERADSGKDVGFGPPAVAVTFASTTAG